MINGKNWEIKRASLSAQLMTCFGLFIFMQNPFVQEAQAQEAAAPAPAPAQQRTCMQYQTIASECTANPQLIRTQNELGVFARLGERSQTGARADVETGAREAQAAATASNQSIQEVRRQCTESARSCTQTCEQEAHRVPEGPQKAAIVQQLQQVARTCAQEHRDMQQRTGLALADIAQIMASVAQLLQALGIGQGGEGGFGDVSGPPTSNDPCEGQFKDMLIECSGQSGPTSTRAGVSGPLGGTTGGTGNSSGLFNSSEQGEPGGERAQAASAGAGAGFGGGMAPMGMAGFGGAGAAGSAAAGSEESGLNTDIHRGYIGTGGGDGGGGGGGGGLGAGRVGAFPTIGKTGDESSPGARSQLDRKINELASQQAGSRAPASADGKNGPYDDNWSVVTNAYKKNTQSLFHQK